MSSRNLLCKLTTEKYAWTLSFFTGFILTFYLCGDIIAHVSGVFVRICDAYAPLAQLVEHLTLNQGVQGSNP